MSPIDPETLATLFDLHAAALELYAAQWSQSPADVVQEAFIQLAAQTTMPETPVPWLFRVVRNGAISAARKSNRRRKHETMAAERSELWFVTNTTDELDARTASNALESLPADQREVIVARIWGGLTFEQIAEVTEISSSAAHRRFEAGLLVLRERLGFQWQTKPTSRNK